MAASSSIVGGILTTAEWDVDAVLRHHNQKQDEQAKVKLDAYVPPPVYGLLTRTVVETPVINWIFPARIRHMDKNDVIFIGDDLVQLRELHADGHLRDIASKSDFGSRIRSALVIGEIPPSDNTRSSSKSEDSDTEMTDAPVDVSNDKSVPVNNFPPQYLVLAMESGDMVFLFVNPLDNTEFVTWRHTVKDHMQRAHPGTNLTFDPSAGYMALACYQNLFVIFELRSQLELAHQYAESGTFVPIKGERWLYRDGIIHKMEFLYPCFEERNRIILLLLVIKASRTKMYVYVWDTGDDLSTLQPQNPSGHRVHGQAQLPILLIPLRINSNFLLVSEDRIMLCKDVLEDAPSWIIPPALIQETSPHHHGLQPPMFTAWARPRRLKEWTYTHDPIYIAREDGLINCLEIDSENDIQGVMNAGTVDCNIGRAFACVDFADQEAKEDDHAAMSTKMGDILVVGGDLSNGATYLITAREHPQLLEPVYNWSPTSDFVVIPTSTGGTRSRRKADGLKNGDPKGKSSKSNGSSSIEVQPPAHEDGFLWPDRIFACSGKGRNGSIAEIRYGLESRHGLVIEYEGYIKQSWVLPDTDENGLFFVLSLVEQSALLHLSSDYTSVPEVEQTETWLDLSSSTILVEQSGEFIVQVTEAGINISNVALQESEHDEHYPKQSYPNPPGKTNVEAVVHNKTLYLTTRIGPGSQIEMKFFQIHSNEFGPCLTQLHDTTILDFEPTCLSMTEWNGTIRGLFATASKPRYLFIMDIGGVFYSVPLHPASKYHGEQQLDEDVCHSIAIIPDGHNQILLCGFRDGFFRSYIVITPNTYNAELRDFAEHQPEFSEHGLMLLPRDSMQVGTTAVTVTVDPLAPDSAFIRCDSTVYRFVLDKIGTLDEPSMCSLHQVWHTDRQEPLALQPFINSVTRFSHQGYRDDGNMLITGDSKILLASLDPRPKAISRNIALGATPRKLFYSEDLRALVVAVILPAAPPQSGSSRARDGTGSGKTNILFIDPESGADMSEPLDKNGVPVEFAKGLGKPEQIMSLGEWKFYKEGEAFRFILVATNTGNLLLISPRKTISPGSAQAKIEYSTKYVFRLQTPVYSFAVSDNGIFICADNKLRWETLHPTEKKFKTVADIDLPSPGLAVEIQGDLVNIVTARHSVFVVKFSVEKNKLRSYLTDQIARNGLQQLAVPHYPLRLVSDRTLSVAGLWYPESPGFTDAMNTVFEAELTTSIVKFQTINTRNKGKKYPAEYFEWFESHEDPDLGSSKVETILGIGIDGSLHHFRVLSQPVWVLLRYIQNIAVHSPLVNPFTYDKQAVDELGNYQIEPLPISKSHMSTRHVNGDILARCKSLGIAAFRSILQQELPGDDEFENGTTRSERFKDLVKECLSPSEREKEWSPHWEAYKLMCWHLLPVL